MERAQTSQSDLWDLVYLTTTKTDYSTSCERMRAEFIDMDLQISAVAQRSDSQKQLLTQLIT